MTNPETQAAAKFVNDNLGEVRSILARRATLPDTQILPWSDDLGSSTREWFKQYVEVITKGDYTVTTSYGPVFDEYGMQQGKGYRWVLTRLKGISAYTMKKMVRNMGDGDLLAATVKNTETGKEIAFTLDNGSGLLVLTTANNGFSTNDGVTTRGDKIPAWILGAILKGDSKKIKFTIID